MYVHNITATVHHIILYPRDKVCALFTNPYFIGRHFLRRPRDRNKFCAQSRRVAKLKWTGVFPSETKRQLAKTCTVQKFIFAGNVINFMYTRC